LSSLASNGTLPVFEKEVGSELKAISILIADDAQIDREQLRRTFSQVHQFSSLTVCNTSIAAEQVKLLQPDVVVLDTQLPHRNGLQLLKEIRRYGPTAVIVMFTADPSVVLKEVCLEAGANFYLHKTQLRELIDICFDRLAQVERR
jgi:CheY-like chemotaxis protein